MKGSEIRLLEYMEGSKKRFVIPVYQRNYDWKRENCKQLYDDLVKVIRNGRKSHFFGSIVSVYDPDAGAHYSEFQVIDGQQRLTTVSLLLLAIYNLVRQGKVTPTLPYLADQIYENFLVDKYQPKETRIKLKPVKNDRAAFGKLFDDPEEHIKNSNLTINYNYFFDRIQKEEITVDQLYDAIFSLEVINITLNQEDNPQLIFESLNSTGVALSEGDKIRNYILMGLTSELQNKYYEKYWNKIEEYTGYDVSMFVRDYLSVKQQEIPSINRVYFAFKTYVEQNEQETENLLIDLTKYAKWYEILKKAKLGDGKTDACIVRLNRLETTVTRPFFLEVLRLHFEEQLSVDHVRQIFLITESYLFRRNICDLPTNALNKIFLMLHREIVRYDGTTENYLEKFKYALLSKQERGRFPETDEFLLAFSTRQIYTMNSKNKIYILERIENHGTDEDKDIYRHTDDGTYSVEHIMPQHLSPTWQQALGESYEQIHETWLHRIANLTLTAYNSEYSNRSFLEKRNIENGFKESGLRMNTWIAAQDKWTLAEIEQRDDSLKAIAEKIWPLPFTEYRPEEKQLEACTLADDVDLSGRELARFALKATEMSASSWIFMMENVLKMLHEQDPAVLTAIADRTDPDNDLSQFVTKNPNALRIAMQIDKDVYVERNTSTATKLNILRKVFRAFGVDAEDLVFYLKTDESSTDEPGTRYELRRKYWTFALPFIQESHLEDGCFSKATPSKENWIAGFFGINGANISCVANFDSARVELCLCHSEKGINKARFDILEKHKAEIENKIGAALNWLRSDDLKGSYINIRLEGVSIQNEVDWTQMAKFQAEWSKKFYDVLVPYLR